MKKTISIVAVITLAVWLMGSMVVSAAELETAPFVRGQCQNAGYVDENQDGICDHRAESQCPVEPDENGRYPAGKNGGYRQRYGCVGRGNGCAGGPGLGQGRRCGQGRGCGQNP